MTTTDATYERLSALRSTLPLLDEALIPGTPRRWAERDLTPEQRTRQDALVVAEKVAKAVNLAKGIKPLGESRAPIRLDVLDAAADITVSVVEMESAVCERLGLTPLIEESTAKRISRLIGLLDRIVLHPDLDEHVHGEAVRLAWSASRAVGDAEQVYRMNARCPNCDCRSLRVLPERELVVCVNNSCRCPEEDCRCRSDRPRVHQWPASQWENLIEQIDGKAGAVA